MSATHKSSKDVAARAAAEIAEAVEGVLPMYTKSVERLADLQKKSLDLAAQQNAELIDASKNSIHRFVPGTSGTFLFDVAGQAFEKYVETQKGAIDLVVEQSQALSNLSKEPVDSVSKAASGWTALLQQWVEYSIATQKKTLDFTAMQNKAAYEASKRQFGISDTPATESFRRGLDALVETQKAVLDMASTPMKSVANA